MAEKPNLMYSNEELEIIKGTFAEQDELLVAIRKLFFGKKISNSDKALIKQTFSNPKVKEVFRKKVYGLNNYDTPIGQLSDFWIGIEQQIFGQSIDNIRQAVESKAMVLNMFEKAFDLLDNPDGEKIDVDYVPGTLMTDYLGVQLIARNLYMKAIETSLLTVKTIAGTKNESIEETLKRLGQDSAK